MTAEYCAQLPDGEEAYCIKHAAEALGIKHTTLYNRVKGDLRHHTGARRLDCDAKWKSYCLVPVGIFLQQDDAWPVIP